MGYPEWLGVIGVVFIVTYVVKFIPMFQSSPMFRTFIYIDAAQNEYPKMVDLDGTPLSETLVTHKNDRFVFVNRTGDPVNVGSDPGLFPPGQQSIDIAPYKRRHTKVAGVPDDEYTLTLTPTGGPVNPPRVKVGQDP